MAQVESRVYLGNLPADADILEIFSICAAFGAVTALEVHSEYAFVDFVSSESRDRLIAAYNGQGFHGKQLQVEAAKTPLSKTSSTVHVVRLPEGTTQASLEERVRPCGNVTKVQLSEQHHFVGLHGVVEFENHDAALKCVALFSDGGDTHAFIHNTGGPRRTTSARGRPAKHQPRSVSRGSASADGPASPAAAAAAAAAVPDAVTLSLLVPIGYAGAIIGKGGELIRRILAESKALVTLATLPQPIPRSTTERLAQVKGTLEQVVDGFYAIAAILLEQNKEAGVVPLRLLVPSELVGHIIGKAGAQIKALKTQIQCNVTIEACTQPEYAALFWQVSADGTVADTAAVVKHVLTRIAAVQERGAAAMPDPMRVNKEESVTLVLPSSAVGAVIGKQGSVLREIAANSHATIDVEKASQPLDSDADRHIWIKGPVSAIEQAQHMIVSCIAGKDVDVRYEMSVPTSVVGHIIGKRGANINAIMDDTRTSIDIEQTGDNSVVSITGSVFNSINVQRIVRKISDERR